MNYCFEVNPSEMNPRGVLYDPFTHVRNFQEAQLRSRRAREAIGGLADYYMDGNSSIVPRTGWKRIQEQPPLCGSPEELMGPAPPTIGDIELTDSEDKGEDSDEDRENREPKSKSRSRKVQVASSTTKKRGTTVRGNSKKASTSTRKVEAVKKAAPSCRRRVLKKAGPSPAKV